MRTQNKEQVMTANLNRAYGIDARDLEIDRKGTITFMVSEADAEILRAAWAVLGVELCVESFEGDEDFDPAHDRMIVVTLEQLEAVEAALRQVVASLPAAER